MSREGLADVLAALSDVGVSWWAAMLAQGARVEVLPDGCIGPVARRADGIGEAALWTVESPAHGVEKLNEAALWPWSPGDVDAPRWFCEACKGTAYIPGWIPCECCGDGRCYEECDLEGTLAVPPSLADLVAVASRGPETLRRVAELVRELRASTSRRVECDECRGWGGHTITTGDGSHGTLEQESCGGAGKVTVYEVSDRVVWRVMTREALAQRYVNVTPKASVTTVADVWDVEMLAYADVVAWPEECPRIYEDRPHLVAAWPALRALAVHEDGKTPTGLHLLDATSERVVIGVEAVGS